MDTNLLMIGNLLQDTDGEIVTVKDIGAMYVHPLGLIDENNLQPIPLTPEWIEDNWNVYFQKNITLNRKRFSIEIRIGGYKLVYYDPPKHWWMFVDLEEFAKRIDYVHELQNCIAVLTNEPLKLK